METVQRGGWRWQRAVYGHMSGQTISSTWASLGLTPLWLVSQLYRGLSIGHYASYACGLRPRKRLSCRVISVGNLTLGGTGKTPLTMWLARWCQQQGWRVAVLSRGYGAHSAEPFQVVSTGDGPLLDWRLVGDEPYLLARALPGIPVLVGRNRYLSGRYACDRFGVQIVILDDGFQHYVLHRDLDVVLIDASNPFGSGTLVPRGILREPLGALRRADAIVLTRVDMAATPLAALRRQIRRWNPCQPISDTTMVVETLHQEGTGVAEETTWLHRRRVVAFSGIGNPPAFTTTLARLGSDVVAQIVFPDHHPYTPADWQALGDLVRQHHAECLVTTEKDAVRLAPEWQAPVPLYTLRIGLRFVCQEVLLQRQLRALMTPA